MKFRTRALVTASAIAVASAVGIVGAVPSNAVTAKPSSTTTFNVANDHMVCDTITGTIKFASALTLSGPTSGPNTATYKAKVTGCTDSDNGSVGIFTGTLTGTTSSTSGTNCTALLGLHSATGTLHVAWKAAKGQAFNPSSGSDISAPDALGGTYTVSGEGSWTSAYGQLGYGADAGASQLSSTGAFTGGNSGHSGWINATTNGGSVSELALCAGTGIKSVTFGIGSLALG